MNRQVLVVKPVESPSNNGIWMEAVAWMVCLFH